MGIMKENAKKLCIGVSEKTYNNIQKLAAKEDRSMSQIIQKILREYFDVEKKDC